MTDTPTPAMPETSGFECRTAGCRNSALMGSYFCAKCDTFLACPFTGRPDGNCPICDDFVKGHADARD